jgi:D-alanine-D-alanine ligase
MKYVAYTEGIESPAYVIVCYGDDISSCKHLRFPLFVKPAHAGDSLGIDEASLVRNKKELKEKVDTLWGEYNEVLVEEYVDGREFTVLVAANAEDLKTCIAFTPLEYIFPADKKFKTYALKTSELHAECNVPVNDESLATQLKAYASRIFRSFGNVGYARLDFRMNAEGTLYFLEINFTCSLFYSGGYEGSADYILKYDGIGQSGFLQHIIEEGIARHKRQRKQYKMRGNALAGFGIYATETIKEGAVIFCGEEGEHRLVTKRHVATTWNEEEQKTFRQYAYPISNEVYSIWDKEPLNWAPQNHSCNANTAYDGLNVVASKRIEKGEELTLDYTEFLNEASAPFECHCGAVNCKKRIAGTKGNSVTTREAHLLKQINSR